MRSLVVFDVSSLKEMWLALSRPETKAIVREFLRDEVSSELLAVVRASSKPEEVPLDGKTLRPSRGALAELLRRAGIVAYAPRALRVKEFKYEDERRRLLRSRRLVEMINKVFEVELGEAGGARREVDRDVHLIVPVANRLSSGYTELRIVTEDSETMRRVEALIQALENVDPAAANRLKVMSVRELLKRAG